MRLSESNISCGLYELENVGHEPDDKEYRGAMRHCDAAIVIASVPVDWKKAIAFLKKKGFKQPLNKSLNPNSGNHIVLLVRNVTKKQRLRFKNARVYCQDCREWNCDCYDDCW